MRTAKVDIFAMKVDAPAVGQVTVPKKRDFHPSWDSNLGDVFIQRSDEGWKWFPRSHFQNWLSFEPYSKLECVTSLQNF